MTTLTPELIADLRKKAEAATPGPWRGLTDGSGCVYGPSGLIATAQWQEHLRHNANATLIGNMSPPMVLALLDKLKEWEAYEDEMMKAQNDAGMSPRRAGEAIKTLLDRIEALEAKWERPSQWRCDGCGAIERPDDGRRPDRHDGCGGIWIRQERTNA